MSFVIAQQTCVQCTQTPIATTHVFAVCDRLCYGLDWAQWFRQIHAVEIVGQIAETQRR